VHPRRGGGPYLPVDWRTQPSSAALGCALGCFLSGRAGVAAIGVAQEFQRVFTAATGAVRAEGGAPHFSWGKADRRVTAYYF
jgi:hypothetical protein